jgi:hypothetical protein
VGLQDRNKSAVPELTECLSKESWSEKLKLIISRDGTEVLAICFTPTTPHVIRSDPIDWLPSCLSARHEARPSVEILKSELVMPEERRYGSRH